jgi:hypothetical protein
VHSLEAIAVNDTTLYDEVATAKRGARRTRLQAARPAVLTAYQRYSDSAPGLENMPDPNLTQRQKEALLHAFEIETAPLKVFRSQLLDEGIEGANCPFCGMGETSTLDHYLPKETYPQFSIFSRNLVPACASCNTLKRDRIRDEDTQVRLFLHPYFDDIPTRQFLRVDVVLSADGLRLNFRVERPQGLPQRTFRHLESHFTLLKLGNRYRRRALIKLGDQYRPLKRAYGTGEDASRVAARLTQKAEDLEEEWGANYWSAVLYRALANHEEFCDGGFEVIHRRRRN